MEQLSLPIVLLAITLSIFAGASALRRQINNPILNPILLTVVVMIVVLKFFDISYSAYQRAGHYIDFWLKPAVVALAVPLYKQLPVIRKQLLPVMASQIAGCVAGLISVMLIAHWLGASQQVVCSMAPKAVTTPIAIEVSQVIGGIPPLTAAVVVTTGIFGAIFGFSITRLCRIYSPIAASIAVGTATHAVGTSAAIEISQRFGAYSSLGLIINGMLTAILAPFILPLIGF